MTWRATNRGGWTATAHGVRYTVDRYRAGREWRYVLRVNGSAESSPAWAYRTPEQAKRRAEALDAQRAAAAGAASALPPCPACGARTFLDDHAAVGDEQRPAVVQFCTGCEWCTEVRVVAVPS